MKTPHRPAGVLSPWSRPLLQVALALSCLALAACTVPLEDEPAAAQAVSEPLKTKDHRSLTRAACRARGLPRRFCERVAAEAFNVDRNEWDALPAHAQAERGQEPCEAANAVAARLRGLGREVREGIAYAPWGGSVERIAVALGRALHTVQDNCAHHGMTNAEHAWYSDRSYCLGTGEDPDGAPGTLGCARDETELVMGGFEDALAEAGVSAEELSRAGEVDTEDPSRSDVCGFLRSWRDFDGEGSRWGDSASRPRFRRTLVDAFTAEPEPEDLCDGGFTIASVDRAMPPLQVTDPTCFTLRVYCLGE